MITAFSCVLLLLQTAWAFECVPSGCVIDVIESGQYTLGFKPDADYNFTRCFYQSDTGISGSFEIKQPEIRRHKARNNNLVSDLGGRGLCQISVSNVDDEGPSFWSLRPSNDATKQNFKELNFTVNFHYKVPLVWDSVSVVERGSFYQYIVSSVKFVSCKLKFGDTEVVINQGETTNERVSSFGEDFCGFTFTNVSLLDPPDWSLSAEDERGRSYKALFKVSVYDRPSSAETNVKQYVVLGSDTSITCGDQYTQDFCYLHNPQGEFVTSGKDCRHTIKTVALHHLGTWKCQISKFPAMELFDYKVELISKETQKINKWMNETDKYVEIGCQLINNGEIGSCRMVSPGNQVFSLRPGTVYDRYLSFGTDFKTGACALMIKKPLGDDDKGQWKCEIHSGSSTRTGTFINVYNSELPSYKKHRTITTQLGLALEIQCEVPYSSEYCYVKSPNGSEYSAPHNFQTRLGSCSFTIEKAKPEHFGNWSCYFARETGTPDDEITITVSVAEILLSTSKLETRSGGNASLTCSAYGLPLQYCRFIAPNSLAYFIGNHENSSRISYKGKGLEYGECGITITNVLTSDSGVWTCVTRVGNDYKQEELTATIELYVAPTFLENPATAIGFGTAGVLIVSGVAVFGVNRWRKKRKPNLATILNDQGSEESSTNDLAIGYSALGSIQLPTGSHAHQP